MIFNFLTIRLIQVKRELLSLGWWRVLLLAAMALFAGSLFYKEMALFPNCVYATAALFLITVLIHVRRKDLRFVRTTGVSTIKLYWAEYSFFSIPFFVLMCCSPHSYCILILLTAYLVFPFLPSSFIHKKRALRVSRFIPKDNFEWIAGFRKNFWPLLILYVVALGLLKYPYASLFVLWIMLAVIASFYMEAEPFIILRLQELPPERFLKTKLKKHLSAYVVFSLPVILGYNIFNFHTAWVGIIVYIFTFINLSFFIVSKYSAYEPNKSLTANNTFNILIHLGLLVPLLPFLLPVPLIMGFRAYKKAQKKLHPYLNAYD